MMPIRALRMRKAVVAPTDPHFASVVSLSHFDGADASTTITDQIVGRTWTAVGNAQLDTAQAKFGASSLLCDGTGDRATLTYSADINISSGDFTLEFFVRPAQVAARSCYLDWRPAFLAQGIFIGQQTATPNKISFFLGDSSTTAWEFSVDSSTISANTWYHVALVRSGNSIYVFLDGVQQGSAGSFTGSVGIGSADMYLGMLRDGNGSHNGWFDEFRLTKGVARYTASFSPPSAAFPNS